MFSIVIPAFEESRTIGEVVRSVAGIEGAEVVVVDDGSRDDTAAVARRAGARVVELGRNQGKGRALDAGVAATEGSDVLVFLDADLRGMDESKVLALVRPVERGAVMAVGVRHSIYHVLNRRSRWLPVVAKLSGQRCVTRSLWRAARRHCVGYGVESALNFHASRRGEIAYIHLPGLRHTIKERKRGLARGLYQRSKMILQILGTALAVRLSRRDPAP